MDHQRRGMAHGGATPARHMRCSAPKAPAVSGDSAGAAGGALGRALRTHRLAPWAARTQRGLGLGGRPLEPATGYSSPSPALPGGSQARSGPRSNQMVAFVTAS